MANYLHTFFRKQNQKSFENKEETLLLANFKNHFEGFSHTAAENSGIPQNLQNE